MDKNKFVKSFEDAIACQNKEVLREFFLEDAYVRWHNTNEHFNLEEFLIANCEYPGEWNSEVERMEDKNDLIILVTHIWTKDNKMSFHVVSFIQLENERIKFIDKYWGDDGQAPQWRLDKCIGSAIQ